MSVVLVTNDLFFGSRVAAAADRVGLPCESCSSLQEAQSLCEQNDQSVVIIDLTLANLDIASWMTAFGGAKRPHVVAFGPHVHGTILDAARDAGCHEVLSRGFFANHLDQLLHRWCQRTEPS